jgi:hypothetical protein
VSQHDSNLEAAMPAQNMGPRPEDGEAHQFAESGPADLASPSEALERLTEALRLSPESPHLHAELAVVHRTLGDHDEAMFDLAQAVRLDPAFTTAYLMQVALRHKAHRNYRLAAADYSIALQLDPSNKAAAEGLEFAMQAWESQDFEVDEPAELDAVETGPAEPLATVATPPPSAATEDEATPSASEEDGTPAEHVAAPTSASEELPDEVPGLQDEPSEEEVPLPSEPEEEGLSPLLLDLAAEPEVPDDDNDEEAVPPGEAEAAPLSPPAADRPRQAAPPEERAIPRPAASAAGPAPKRAKEGPETPIPPTSPTTPQQPAASGQAQPPKSTPKVARPKAAPAVPAPTPEPVKERPTRADKETAPAQPVQSTQRGPRLQARRRLWAVHSFVKWLVLLVVLLACGYVGWTGLAFFLGNG